MEWVQWGRLWPRRRWFGAGGSRSRCRSRSGSRSGSGSGSRTAGVGVGVEVGAPHLLQLEHQVSTLHVSGGRVEGLHLGPERADERAGLDAAEEALACAPALPAVHLVRVRVRVRVRVKVRVRVRVRVRVPAVHRRDRVESPLERLTRAEHLWCTTRYAVRTARPRLVRHAGGWYAWPVRTVRRRPRGVRVSIAEHLVPAHEDLLAERTVHLALRRLPRRTPPAPVLVLAVLLQPLVPLVARRRGAILRLRFRGRRRLLGALRLAFRLLRLVSSSFLLAAAAVHRGGCEGRRSCRWASAPLQVWGDT
eukprot:scaffold4337_cov51-Phaeocystis_antarctica.AAC.1